MAVGYGFQYPSYEQMYGYPGNNQSYGYPNLSMFPGGQNPFALGSGNLSTGYYPGTNQQGGGLSQTGVNVGLGMMPFNPLLGGAIAAGSSLLGGLGKLIGGPSAGEKRKRETYSMAKGELGKSVIDPNRYMADYQRYMLPQFNRQAEMINRRLGLDTGVGQSELAYNMQAPLAGFRWQSMQRADELKNARDMALYRLMASLGME